MFGCTQIQVKSSQPVLGLKCLSSFQLRRRQDNPSRSPGDHCDPGADLQTVHLLAGKGFGADPTGEVFRAHSIGQVDERRGHSLFIRMTVGCLVGQDVPDGYQQLAGNGHNRFGPSKANLQLGQLLFTSWEMRWEACARWWMLAGRCCWRKATSLMGPCWRAPGMG
jgi:hypothetical protein